LEERLRQLEKEQESIRQEREEEKKQRMAPPVQEGAKFPIQFGASITVRYDITKVEDKTELRVDDTQSGFRTRDRFWAEFPPDGPVQAGLRFSTTTDSPTVPFIRMGNIFRTKSFDIDQVYINLRPIKFLDRAPFAEHPFQVSLLAGKMPN